MPESAWCGWLKRTMFHYVRVTYEWVRGCCFRTNRYGHARQMRRQRRTTAELRTMLGRVVRDIGRRLPDQPTSVQAAFAESMALTKRLLDQHCRDNKKLYALRAPETVSAEYRAIKYRGRLLANRRC